MVRRQTQRISGDRIPALLKSDVHVARVLVDPPPRSWDSIKPDVVRALARGGERRLPELVGYPLCALGDSWRALEPITGPALTRHEPCTRCALVSRCSPPVVFDEDELQPFTATDPQASWDSYHAVVSEAFGLPRRARIDDVVKHHLDDCRHLPGDPIVTLEPSLVVADTIEPTLRLAIFHGRLPKDASDAARATSLLLDSWAQMHAHMSIPVADDLLACLRAHAPFQFPVGFEIDANGHALLKGYLRTQHFSPEQREQVVRELPRWLGLDVDATRDRLERLVRSRSTFWHDLEMIGIATPSPGAAACLKLYLLLDTAFGWREVDLPAMDRDHPLERLSNHRAYGVLDLAPSNPRAPKWDYFLRERLVSGPVLARYARRLFSDEAADQLARLVLHDRFRVDLVAAAIRKTKWTLYLELS